MNLLLIGVLLALVAIAYQLGLRKSRNIDRWKQLGDVTFSSWLLWRTGWSLCGIPAF